MVESETVQQAEEILGYRFEDPSLLDEALTHASIADSRIVSNERLEFLGDAVLGIIVCDHLFRTFPDLLEGDLTKIKSVAVSRRTCAKIAKSMGLGELLRLGKGMQTHSELPPSLLAAVMESVIGAIYLDGGLEAAQSLMMPLLAPVIARAARSGHQQNFKSVLQHVAQDRFGLMPSYVLLDEKGPDHAKCFKVNVEIGDQRFDACWGASKKQSEQMAALKALEALGVTEDGEDGEVTIINGQAERISASDEEE